MMSAKKTASWVYHAACTTAVRLMWVYSVSWYLVIGATVSHTSKRVPDALWVMVKLWGAFILYFVIRKEAHNLERMGMAHLATQFPVGVGAKHILKSEIITKNHPHQFTVHSSQFNNANV